MADKTDIAVDEFVYVSWGGTGRASTLRHALAEASIAGRGLVYLAILDNGAFADVDESMVALAADELAWLLEAQTELAKTQVGADDVAVRVLIRAGNITDEVGEVVAAVGETEVLIGAPVALADHGSIDDLVTVLADKTGVPVRVVEVAT